MCRLDDQIGIQLLGQVNDLRHDMACHQVIGDARFKALLQLDGQGVQPRARVVLDSLRGCCVPGPAQFVERARGQRVNQRELRIVHACQVGSAVACVQR